MLVLQHSVFDLEPAPARCGANSIYSIQPSACPATRQTPGYPWPMLMVIPHRPNPLLSVRSDRRLRERTIESLNHTLLTVSFAPLTLTILESRGVVGNRKEESFEQGQRAQNVVCVKVPHDQPSKLEDKRRHHTIAVFDIAEYGSDQFAAAFIGVKTFCKLFPIPFALPFAPWLALVTLSSLKLFPSYPSTTFLFNFTDSTYPTKWCASALFHVPSTRSHRHHVKNQQKQLLSSRRQREKRQEKLSQMPTPLLEDIYC